ncbi:MAG: hypothetical protein ACR2GD_11660 [Pyrinomonadaceae bacterium]
MIERGWSLKLIEKFLGEPDDKHKLGKTSEIPNRLSFPTPPKSIASLMIENDYVQFGSDHRKFNQLEAINELIGIGILIV